MTWQAITGGYKHHTSATLSKSVSWGSLSYAFFEVNKISGRYHCYYSKVSRKLACEWNLIGSGTPTMKTTRVISNFCSVMFAAISSRHGYLIVSRRNYVSVSFLKAFGMLYSREAKEWNAMLIIAFSCLYTSPSQNPHDWFSQTNFRFFSHFRFDFFTTCSLPSLSVSTAGET